MRKHHPIRCGSFIAMKHGIGSVFCLIIVCSNISDLTITFEHQLEKFEHHLEKGT